MRLLNVGLGGRQNVGRVDHIVLQYPSREARDAARADYQRTFGFDQWTEVGVIAGANVDVIIDWTAGVELLCPAGPPDGSDAAVAEDGPVFLGLVFGVADLDAARERAHRHGARTIPIILAPEVDALTAERFAVGREAIIPAQDMGGIPIVLGDFKPLPGHEPLRVDDHGFLYPDAVDHVVFAFADEARLLHARERLEAVLGIDVWQDLGVIEPGGLRVLLAPQAGMELIAPAQADSPLMAVVGQAPAAQFFAQVINSSTFDAVAHRVVAAGGRAHEQAVHPALLAQGHAVRHTHIGRVGGVRTMLSEVRASDHTAR